MRLAIMLFTRDLRLHEKPALAAAAHRAQALVPLFVLDDRLAAAPNRVRFLLEALTDLRAGLRERGGELIIRRGDPVTEVIGLARDTGADGVFCADDVSGYAAARRRRLTAGCRAARLELTLCPGVTVVPPGELRPSGGGDHYRVFTPYLRAWERAARRPVAATPDQVRVPAGLTAGDLPDLAAARHGTGTFPGGETAATGPGHTGSAPLDGAQRLLGVRGVQNGRYRFDGRHKGRRNGCFIRFMRGSCQWRSSFWPCLSCLSLGRSGLRSMSCGGWHLLR
jgi:deoxyribodipyrimidine photo-lyase